MPDTNYAVSANVDGASNDWGVTLIVTDKTTTGFTLNSRGAGNGTGYDRGMSFVVHATNAVLPQSFTEEQIQTVIDAATEGQVPTYSATQTTTSGTSVTFTDVPSWARKITVMFQGVSHASGS